MHWVYILRCADGSYYVGNAQDVPERLRVHSAGRGPAYTAKRLPIQLVYHERSASLSDAVRREKQLKKSSRAKKEALIQGDMERLARLSKSHQGASKTSVSSNE
ncbi:MAG: GIY-YIG nuclease family protein [Pirellulales bacterium]